MSKSVGDIYNGILSLTGGDPVSSYQALKDEKIFYSKRHFQRRKEYPDLPRFLYKFYGWNFDDGIDDIKRRRWFLDSMTSNKLRLSSRLDFNDPFDLYPSIDDDYDIEDVRDLFKAEFKRQGMRGLEIKKRIDPAVSDFVNDREVRLSRLCEWTREFHNNVGIFCLTENVREILMWSHYANSHKGFCLVIDPYCDADFFGYLHKVKYEVERPVVTVARKSSGSDFDKTCLQKAKCWSYEKEWRYVSRKKAHSFLELKDGIFKGFILGMNRDEEVLSLLSDVNLKRLEKGLSKIPIFSTTMDEKKFSFRFKMLS